MPSERCELPYLPCDRPANTYTALGPHSVQVKFIPSARGYGKGYASFTFFLKQEAEESELATITIDVEEDKSLGPAQTEAEKEQKPPECHLKAPRCPFGAAY